MIQRLGNAMLLLEILMVHLSENAIMVAMVQLFGNAMSLFEILMVQLSGNVIMVVMVQLFGNVMSFLKILIVQLFGNAMMVGSLVHFSENALLSSSEFDRSIVDLLICFKIHLIYVNIDENNFERLLIIIKVFSYCYKLNYLFIVF